MARNVEQFGYAIHNHELIFWEGIWGDMPNESYHNQYSVSLINPISFDIWQIDAINDTVTNYSSSWPITASQQTQVQINNLVYTVSPGGDWSNYLLIFDVNKHSYYHPDTYSSVIPNSSEGYNHSCVTSDQENYIYSIGGMSANKEYLDSTLVYDIKGDEWSYLSANMTNPRGNFGCSMDVKKENIFVFSGAFGNVSDQTIEKYNFGDNEWMILENIYLPYGFYYGNCILYPLDENIYCIGGATGNVRKGYNIGYVQIFNPNDYSFKIKNLTMARSNFGIGLYGDCMLVFGGRINGNALVDTPSIEGLNCNFTYI